MKYMEKEKGRVPADMAIGKRIYMIRESDFLFMLTEAESNDVIPLDIILEACRCSLLRNKVLLLCELSLLCADF